MQQVRGHLLQPHPALYVRALDGHAVLAAHLAQHAHAGLPGQEVLRLLVRLPAVGGVQVRVGRVDSSQRGQRGRQRKLRRILTDLLSEQQGLLQRLRHHVPPAQTDTPLCTHWT
jgi:hypothetical protein